jgi:two-component system, cell cycle sensor histidine kinase and response regulator CckA
MSGERPMRLLLVEDSADDETLIVRALGGMTRPFRHRRVESEPQLRAALESEPWDVVISDFVLPGFSGLRTIAVTQELRPGLPVVIVSGTIGEDIAVDAVRRGATDYVMKSNLGRLAYAVERAERDAQERRERQAERVAREQAEHRFAGVLDAVPTAIIVVGTDGIVVQTNQHVTATFGYEPDELIGQSVDVLVPEAQLSLHVAERARYAADPATRMHGVGREVIGRRKDGTSVPVEVGLAAIQSAGELLIVAAAHDISRRLEIEAQLQESQRMEALGRLAGGIAHDFNNLLTAINGYAELLAIELPPESGLRDDVAHIRAAGDRGAVLVRQLLAFGRRSSLRPGRLDLVEAFGSLRPLLDRIVTEAVDLTVDVDPATPPVHVDRGQFDQAIINLVANARDAMVDGGTVTIAVAPGVDGATIAVSDTGHGIDGAVRPHLFTPFFTTKESGKGTGLGLASVHGFVSQSGGRIEVETSPGIGTTFTIHLPGAPAIEEESAPAGVSVPAGTGGGEFVLLVEDDDPVRALARTILERAGFDVLEVGDPTRAEAVLREVSVAPAVLVTDVVMPGLDGRALARRLRERDPRIGVVFTSGYTPDERHLTTDEAQEELEEAIFVPKPFDPAALSRAVRQAIDRRAR